MAGETNGSSRPRRAVQTFRRYTKRSGRITIAGTMIAPGESREIQLRFSESYLGLPVSVPIYILRAKKPGPHVFITGGIHGDELNGMGIVRELLYNQPPALTRGMIILVPVVNIDGLDHHSRYLPDRRDLNRCFPGTETGSPSNRLAYSLLHEIVAHCDYGIDFHSAAVRRTNYPNVRANLRHPGVRELAIAFGSELVVSSTGPEGSLRRTATDLGVPTIILEAGEVWKIEPGVVEVGVRGCLNVLSHLDMIEGDPIPPPFQAVIDKTTWVRTSRGGILGFHAKPGDLIAANQELATCTSLFGRERSIITSPVPGLVLGMTTMPAVKPGDAVYHIAKLSQREYRRIEKQLDHTASRSLYARLQRQLATNITITERTH